MEYFIERDKYFKFKEYPKNNNRVNKVIGNYAKFDNSTKKYEQINNDYVYFETQKNASSNDYPYSFPSVQPSLLLATECSENRKKEFNKGFSAKLFGVKCIAKRVYNFGQTSLSIEYVKADGSTTTNFNNITEQDYVEFLDNIAVLTDRNNYLYVNSSLSSSHFIISEYKEGWGLGKLTYIQEFYSNYFIKFFGENLEITYDTSYSFSIQPKDGVLFEKRIQNNSLIQEGSTYNNNEDIASYIANNIFANYANGRSIAQLDWIGSPEIKIGDTLIIEPKFGNYEELPKYTIMGKTAKFTGGYSETLYLIQTDVNKLSYGEKYYTDGIVLNLDATKNIINTHSQVSNVWKDLSGNSYDGQLVGFNTLNNEISNMSWSLPLVEKSNIGLSYFLDATNNAKSIDYAYSNKNTRFYANRSFIYGNKVYLVSTQSIEVFNSNNRFVAYKSINLGLDGTTDSVVESFISSNGYIYILTSNNKILKIDCDIDSVSNTMVLPNLNYTWTSLAVVYDYSKAKYKIMLGTFGSIEQFLINSDYTISYFNSISTNNYNEVTDIKINNRRAYCAAQTSLLEINTDSNEILRTYTVTNTKDIHYHNGYILTNNDSDFVAINLNTSEIKVIKSGVNIFGLSIGYDSEIGNNILYCGSVNKAGFSVNLNTFEVINIFDESVDGTDGYWYLIGYMGYVYFTDLSDYTKILKVGYPEYIDLSSNTNVSFSSNHKYYIFFNYYQDLYGGNIQMFFPYWIDAANTGNHIILNNYALGDIGAVRRCSVIFEPNDNSLYFSGIFGIRFNNPNSSSAGLWINNICIVDLTTEFGVGKEPTKEWCDSNLLDDCTLSSNGVLSFRNGWRGDHLKFDGNTYVKLPEINNQNITLEVVYSIDEISSNEQHICSNVESGGYGMSIFQNYNGGIQVYVNGNKSLYSEILPNKIYSQSGSFDGSTLTLYTNGIAKTLDVTGDISSTINNTILALGGNPSGNNVVPTFKGNIYAVRLYNKALSEYEILNNLEVDKKKYGI